MLILAAQSEEPVSSVVLLAQHLEASNLQDFWAATNSCKDTIKQGQQACHTYFMLVFFRQQTLHIAQQTL